MLKNLILILLLNQACHQQEQADVHDDIEDPDLLKGLGIVKKYFDYLQKDVLTKEEATNALVLAFDEIEYENLEKIDTKEELTPSEEEIKSFKDYLKRYFDQRHLDEELNFELIKDILSKNYLLEFLQGEMEREESEVFNNDYEMEEDLNFADLDDLKTLEDEGELPEEELKEGL